MHLQIFAMLSHLRICSVYASSQAKLRACAEFFQRPCRIRLLMHTDDTHAIPSNQCIYSLLTIPTESLDFVVSPTIHFSSSPYKLTHSISKTP